ncbi:MAG TPA: cbb3-type cytochrome c oxidase subunit I [Streptosporangiaceae bacterium]|nr:cbb3-type cytochrome c oxidase subunit I [Streptosporangiaceae bacterium]
MTTTDHKKIGIMYLVNSFVFFAFAGALAMIMRTQLMQPGNTVLSPEAFNQAFTIHGTIMIFLVILPLLSGFGNYFVPLQIGALDMAFPRVNAASFWLLPVGGLTVIAGYFTKGGAAAAGWTNYVPLSLQGGTGEDLWILGLAIVGTSSLLGAINFIVTVLRLRAPGMTLTRMPIFAWATTTTSILIVLAVPSLTAALLMLLADHHLGTVFFNPAHGGSIANYLNTFWFFGHPEVYMLIMGAWGIVSEIVPVFSRKPLYGYRFVILALMLIMALSFTVWGHHMYTTGLVNDSFFSVTTELISVPTGVLVLCWLFTLWKGKLSFEPPMLFALGFIAMFVIGGIDGVWMASPAADFSIHDTYFVVSHIHYVLVGGSLFGIFAGLYYWFPKMSGRMLSRKLGQWQFWLLIISFNVTFFPMHFLGLWGMPRRVATYPVSSGWGLTNMIETISAYVIALSMLIGLLNIIITLRKPRNAPADPWGGNSLEWATSSPPPVHNFDALPEIRSERPVRDLRLAVSAAARSAGPQTAPRPDGATPRPDGTTRPEAGQ